MSLFSRKWQPGAAQFLAAKMEERDDKKFCFKTRKAVLKTYEHLKTAFGGKCLSPHIWFP